MTAIIPPTREASGEVISNSNVLLWKPSCTIEDAYSGGFTAYARKQDGVESEGFPVSAPVTIAAPRVVAEPMQGFTCDTSISGVPAHLTFTLTTSTDVTAVRVVDSYNTPVVSHVPDRPAERGRQRDRKRRPAPVDAGGGSHHRLFRRV